ncbi:MAG TPA: ABC transporter ATP-binding protein [Ktedonobacteraceae bacterium]|nr:ABC transporter ATP-binding protein [Ktedonobacteraceae bacterium]
MINALETNQLGKCYGKHWALRNCTLQIPQGCVAGLLGLNGAGKTTLLHLAAGLLKSTEGTVEVLGISSRNPATLLSRIGFVSQECTLYRHFTVSETLTMGGKLNPHWDETRASALIERLHLPLQRAIGKLSGGQQAQLALVMALAKRPEILFLDEPFAHGDPLAKRELAKILMETAVEQPFTIIVSSHNLSELEHICDYYLILTPSQVKLAESLGQIEKVHKRLIGPRESFEAIAQSQTVLQAHHVGRQSIVLARMTSPLLDPSWQIEEVALEDIMLAYLALQEHASPPYQSNRSMKEVLL